MLSHFRPLLAVVTDRRQIMQAIMRDLLLFRSSNPTCFFLEVISDLISPRDTRSRVSKLWLPNGAILAAWLYSLTGWTSHQIQGSAATPPALPRSFRFSSLCGAAPIREVQCRRIRRKYRPNEAGFHPSPNYVYILHEICTNTLSAKFPSPPRFIRSQS